MPKSIFIFVILLVCILLAFIGNSCTFIHPVGEEEYEILDSLLAGTFIKAKKRIKKGEGWNQNERVDSQTSYTLANMRKTVAI